MNDVIEFMGSLELERINWAYKFNKQIVVNPFIYIIIIINEGNTGESRMGNGDDEEKVRDHKVIWDPRYHKSCEQYFLMSLVKLQAPPFLY